jgi:hypothetical protein
MNPGTMKPGLLSAIAHDHPFIVPLEGGECLRFSNLLCAAGSAVTYHSRVVDASDGSFMDTPSCYSLLAAGR